LGSVVFGLQLPPNEFVLFASSMHVTLTSGGATVRDEMLGTGSPDIIATPRTYELHEVPEGTDVAIALEVDPGNGFGTRIQRANTTILRDRTSLLRVTLTEGVCGSGCLDSQTCNWDRCMDPHLAPELLEAYSPDWASYSYCKPKESPPAPTALFGQGDMEFQPMDDGAIAQLHQGSQGGNHVYTALRMRGLRQFSLVQVSGTFPDLGASIGPFAAQRVFSDNPAAGGCEMLGFVTRVDADIDVGMLFGKTLNLTVDVSDTEGGHVSLNRTVVLSSDSIPSEP